MKLRIIMSVVALGIVLAGCSGGTVDNSGKSVEPTKNKTAKVEHKKPKKDSREVTNGELLKVGQWWMMSREELNCTRFALQAK